VADESNTIRIGTVGTQTATFIAGIRDVTTGNGDAITVVIDSAGQLGTMSSSGRFKKEIKPMDQTSEAILGLKPVTFHYKGDSKSTPQFGLIAEDVEKVNPDLVARDAKGQIYTVRYDAVNAMLLNEFLKEHRKVEEQQATVTQVKSTAAKQDATITRRESVVAQQQNEISTLRSEIQKVSAQLELRKPAPQVANNNQ
jgi:septal ring factor EnvC (AmiA/AmiB activator)